MHDLVITNIKQLINARENTGCLRGKDMAVLPAIENAYLIVEDGFIAGYGKMEELLQKKIPLPNQVIDATGKFILPCWCDSHSHLVFTGSRENEFIDKIRGLGYAEIAARGGGILNSAQKLNETPEADLYAEAWKRLTEIAATGTGAIEIKSGYGLSVEGELKMLRVIKELKQHSSLIIKSTFLGAHTYPLAYRENHQGYIDLIINDMLPVIHEEKLADYIDVFCETGFFSPEETAVIARAGADYGLKPKLHVNQLNNIGGVEAGIALNAVSLDHLEEMDDTTIEMLGKSSTIGTLLPSAAFFLGMGYPPARKLIKAGAAVALASDYNPGSSPSGNMNFVISLACIRMKMLPEEAINAATINGACAMEIQDFAGTIAKGKLANLIITKPIPSIAYLPYSFGNNLIEQVMIRGNFI
ncbi:MAG TPA: imidazolonepropionase [Ferruginibacter sp.]|nr:imidazolonepropionase [Ferruginibacter sp.]